MEIDWIEALRVVPRSLISLITLFLITKLIGKKQISQLSLFDYVIGISIGSFGAEMALNLDGQYVNGIIAIIVYGLTSYLASFMSMKSLSIRKILVGDSTIIIQNGKLLRNNMKKTKLEINDLLEQCRADGYFDINEIEYAILESNGKLSILPKSQFKPLTPKDMNLKVGKSGLCANIIIDGIIIKNILKSIYKDEIWLKNELKIKGYKLENILLATLDINENLKIFEKNEKIKNQEIL
ncbi:MAG: DUF421 domain-containing protein [Bacilli bacterium]